MDSGTRTMASRMLTVEVTIPGSATPVTILSLVATAVNASGPGISTGRNVCGFSILGLDSAGNSRPALRLGDAVGNMKSYYAAGADVVPPFFDLAACFVAAVVVGSHTATIEVYLL